MYLMLLLQFVVLFIYLFVPSHNITGKKILKKYEQNLQLRRKQNQHLNVKRKLSKIVLYYERHHLSSPPSVAFEHKLQKVYDDRRILHVSSFGLARPKFENDVRR